MAKDEFKFSVAKGESVTLSYDYTGSLTGNYSADIFDSTKVGASITITCKYSKGSTYSGPGETSPYNSREFRMKFYQETGTYTQTRDKCLYAYNVCVARTKETVTGTYKKPTYYVSYSVDSYVVR